MFSAFLLYFDSNSKKSDKSGNKDDPQIRNVRKQRFDRHANKVYSAKNEAVETNVNNESQDTCFNEETGSDPVQVSPAVDYCINSK